MDNEKTLKTWTFNNIEHKLIEYTIKPNHITIKSIEKYLKALQLENNKTGDIKKFEEIINGLKERDSIKYFSGFCFFTEKILITNSISGILKFIPIKNEINIMEVISNDNYTEEELSILGEGRESILFGFDTLYEYIFNSFKNPAEEELIKRTQNMSIAISEAANYELDFLMAKDIIEKLKIIDQYHSYLNDEYGIKPYLGNIGALYILADAFTEKEHDEPNNPFGEQL